MALLTPVLFTVAVQWQTDTPRCRQNADDQPNPRSTCTERYGYASNYVAQELEKSGLNAIGQHGSYTFLFHSRIVCCCFFSGIRNAIGMVRGAVHHDEYIVLAIDLNAFNLVLDSNKSE